jgi:type IV pilus assembly protein PilE
MNRALPSCKGFNLIELMVTVAIIGILASIAIPSYSRYIERAKASDAVNVLAATAISMDQKLQDTGSYACVTAAWANNYFSFSCAATATDYTITATGINSMISYAYSIDAEGSRKTLAHPHGTSNDCWRISGGEC